MLHKVNKVGKLRKLKHSDFLHTLEKLNAAVITPNVMQEMLMSENGDVEGSHGR